MTPMIRRWRQARRHRATLYHLKALSAVELRLLWMTPKDIPDLARKAAGL